MPQRGRKKLQKKTTKIKSSLSFMTFEIRCNTQHKTKHVQKYAWVYVRTYACSFC